MFFRSGMWYINVFRCLLNCNKDILCVGIGWIYILFKLIIWGRDIGEL